MAITEKEITKQNFRSFFEQIKPYLSGSGTASTGFTPVGTIISVMATAAPKFYLKCDGTVYNIADYPELAKHFEDNFGSKNYFGGNGTTTFAVPDLRGEFLRGTGTNSHSYNGNGENVGVHQDATQIPELGAKGDGLGLFVRSNSLQGSSYNSITNQDFFVGASGTHQNNFVASTKNSTSGTNDRFTTRPTNTSVLYCIAIKDIYIYQKNNYSTDEQVVGTWIDGKPLYSKTVEFTITPGDSNNNLAIPFGNMENLISISGYLSGSSGSYPLPLISKDESNNIRYAWFWASGTSHNLIFTRNDNTYWNSLVAHVIPVYTKTTD